MWLYIILRNDEKDDILNQKETDDGSKKQNTRTKAKTTLDFGDLSNNRIVCVFMCKFCWLRIKLCVYVGKWSF